MFVASTCLLRAPCSADGIVVQVWRYECLLGPKCWDFVHTHACMKIFHINCYEMKVAVVEWP